MTHERALHRIPVAALLLVLIAGLGVAVVAGSATAQDASSGAASSALSHDPSTEDVEATLRYERADEPGVIRIELTVPESEVEPGAEFLAQPFGGDEAVVDYEGFREDGGTQPKYELTDDPGPATITFEWKPEYGHQFEAGGDQWAFVEQPLEQATGNSQDYDIVYEHELADDGYVTPDGWVFVGEHERATVEVDESASVTVIRPAGLDEAPQPTAAAELLAAVHERQTAGDLAGEYTVVAYPSSVGLVGQAVDDDTAVVAGDESLDGIRNPWIHEYAHLLDGTFVGDSEADQIITGDRLGDGMTWFAEGYANYQERRLGYQFGSTDYESYRSQWDGVDGFDETLAEQDRPGETINYEKGSLVLTAIDREIRLATDDQRTLGDVQARMTAQAREEDGFDAYVDLEDFLAMVEEVGGTETAERARAWIETTETPERWDRSAHVDVFGAPADTSVEFVDVRVRNTADEESLDVADPRELSPNEEIVFEFEVANDGADVGFVAESVALEEQVPGISSDAEYASNGTLLAPGETRSLKASHHFVETGTYRPDDDRVGQFELSVTLQEVGGVLPRDVNGDGLRRDLNADGQVTQTDVSRFFDVQHRSSVQDHWPAYDYDGDGSVDLGDVLALFEDA